MRALLVAFRGFAGAKSRLAALLGPEERALLARVMLEHVLAACLELGHPVYLVTPDPEAAALGREAGALPLPDPGRGLNFAVDSASRTLAGSGFSAVGVLPGDLPLLSPSSLREAFDRLPSPGVLLAPDARGEGTNLLARDPPLAIPARFGSYSALRHLTLSLRAGLPAVLWNSRALAEDVDNPEDLARVAMMGPVGASAGRALSAIRKLLAQDVGTASERRFQ